MSARIPKASPANESPHGSRIAMSVVTGLLVLVGPVPEEMRFPLLVLLAAAGLSAGFRRGLPAWGAVLAAAVVGGPSLAEAWWIFRPSAWCGAAALWAGALLLMRARPGRALTVFFLNVFILAVAVPHASEGLGAAALATAVLAWLLILQYAYRPPGVRLAWRTTLAETLRLLIPVGLAVLLFSALLPEREEVEAESGFRGAGILEAGAFGRVRLSDRPAFRARFEQDRPPARLYWRGDVLEDNLGFTWRRLRTMETPGSRAGQPLIEMVDPGLSSAPWLETEDSRDKQPPGKLAAELLSVPRPISTDGRIGEFLEGAGGSGAAEIISGISERFSRGGFTYSLRPGRIGRLQVGRFLTETRTGFCEHYAAATANLLRAAGVPSRVVTGFRGGSWNPWTKTLTVRALHAHAWVEAWDHASARWIRFDPTDSVTNELTLRDASEWDPAKWSWADWLAKRLEAFFMESPAIAAASLGVGMAGLAGLGVGLLLVVRDRRARRHPAHRFLARLEAGVYSRALRRRTGETPLAWMSRVARARPRAAARWKAAATRYEQLAYMRQAPRAGTRPAPRAPR